MQCTMLASGAKRGAMINGNAIHYISLQWVQVIQHHGEHPFLSKSSRIKIFT